MFYANYDKSIILIFNDIFLFAVLYWRLYDEIVMGKQKYKIIKVIFIMYSLVKS